MALEQLDIVVITGPLGLAVTHEVPVIGRANEHAVHMIVAVGSDGCFRVGILRVDVARRIARRVLQPVHVANLMDGGVGARVSRKTHAHSHASEGNCWIGPQKTEPCDAS